MDEWYASTYMGSVYAQRFVSSILYDLGLTRAMARKLAKKHDRPGWDHLSVAKVEIVARTIFDLYVTSLMG